MRDLKIADRMARKISAHVAPEYVEIVGDSVCISGVRHRPRVIGEHMTLGEFVSLCKMPAEELVKNIDSGHRLKHCLFEVRLGET